MNGVTFLAGKSWTGKTARMLYELRDEPRVLLLDAKCADLANLSGWKHLWPESCPDRGGWRSRAVPDYLRAYLGDGEFRAVVHCRDSHVENLELVCTLLPYVRNCVLAIDELALFLPSRSPSIPPKTLSVVISGRHEGIAVMGTVQRPSLVHLTARTQATRWLIYRLITEGDARAIREAAPVPDEFLAEVSGLPDYHCIDWNDGGPCFIDGTLTGKFSL